MSCTTFVFIPCSKISQTVPATFQLSTADRLHLHGRYFLPPGEVKAAIVLLHGMGEHFGRYTHVAEFFRNRGYAVIGMDHRGHGTSAGKRGHTPSFNHLMNDIDLLLKKTTELFPGTPFILYGHSMGGNLAANYVLRKQPQIKGLILTGPYFKLGFEPPAWKLAMATFMAKIFPSLSLPTALEQEALSRDLAVVEAYKKDLLVHDRISAAFFTQVHAAGLYAIDHAGELQVKTLAMHGTADRLTSPEGTKTFAKNNPKQIALKLWDGFYHEIHNEPDKEQVFHYMEDWIEKL